MNTGSIPPPNPLSYEGQVVVPFINRRDIPQTTFNKFPVPTIWINTLTKIPYILVNKELGVATWVPFGSGSGTLSTITTPDAVIVMPTAGNINFLNGTGMNITGSGDDITFNSSGSVPIQFTADSGSAVPALGNLNILGGTTGLTTVGAGSTISLAGALNVTHGGTGATTLTGILIGHGTSAVTGNPVTQHSVLIGGAANAITSATAGTNGQVLLGSTGADPAFGTLTSTLGSLTYTPGAASLNIDVTGFATGSWTPTITGGTIAGATTYATQLGGYTRIGNVVTVSCILQISAATGTGDAQISGLPFTIGQMCSCATQWGGAGWTWPAGRTSLNLEAIVGSTTMIAKCSGTATGAATMQMANASLTIAFSLTYLV